jgi:hypothetical protein
MDQQLLQRSVDRYQQIARMQTEIEQALQARNNDRMVALATDMTVLQEEAKADDAALLDCLRRQPDVEADDTVRSLLALMEDIRTRNQRLTSQLQGIMAVQRNELQKLKQGNTVLQGYRPVNDQTGKRISVSN